jgi:hypothetical protein
MWMRCMALGAALVAVSGCGRGVTVVGVAPRPDRPPDTAIDVDSDADTGEPGQTGAVRLTYSFGANGIGVTDCASAGLDTLRLTLTDDGDRTLGPWSYPCNDDQVRAGEIPAGAWWDVELAGERTSGARFSGTALLWVEAGADAETSLVLECDENGVDDACGGA